MPRSFFYACSIRLYTATGLAQKDYAVHRYRTADGHYKVLLSANYRDAVPARASAPLTSGSDTDKASCAKA